MKGKMKKLFLLPHDCQRGFSLMEVVIALALLGLVSISLLSLLLNSYAYRGVNAKKTQLVGLAQEQMESIRAMSYDELWEYACSINPNFSRPGEIARVCSEPVPGYEGMFRSLQLEAQSLQVAGHPVDVLKITVEAHYRSQGSSARSVVFNSLLKDDES